MYAVRPIPRRLLPDKVEVCAPDGRGGYEEARTIRHVRFERTQRACDEEHRSADAGGGVIFIDARASDGAFEIATGSRILVDGQSLYATEVKRLCTANGSNHHWEVSVS